MIAAARAYQRAAERRFPPGVTALQAAVLGAVAENPSRSGRSIARAVTETAQTTHDALMSLERAGYIERRVSAVNARVREAQLTQTGRDVLLAVRRTSRAIEKIALANVTPDEARHLGGILKRIQTALETHTSSLDVAKPATAAARSSRPRARAS
jgi:DNA-binding MarR family transcriptional regulator